MPSINGALLDAAEDELRGRTKDDAIYSSELAEKIGVDDGEGNPKTREVIRVLMDERDLPVASSNCGYWMLESEDQLRVYVNDLEGRINGIEERIQMVQENFHQAIADGGVVTDRDPDETDIRRAIKRYAEDHDTVMRDDLSDAVSTALGCDPVDVQSQLDKMVDAGLAYLVDGEVRLP